MNNVLRIHPKDNVIIALRDLSGNEIINLDNNQFKLISNISAKQKFATKDFSIGDAILMYGVTVGKATREIKKGALISVENVVHDIAPIDKNTRDFHWEKPAIDRWKNRTFSGYHRNDGKVGVANYWIVVPMVFCENRNIEVIKRSMLQQLGYQVDNNQTFDITPLIESYQNSAIEAELKSIDLLDKNVSKSQRVFKNVDGIKFLTHQGGCGGTRNDAKTLCDLIAGYIANPNVAGATILSLGCQNAQISLLQESLELRYPNLSKPMFYHEQQQSENEREFIADIIKSTFIGLAEANKIERKPAPLNKLVVGLECGGSDGFSGISANPALGHTSDLLNALGGATILSEFPELNGVEQELINRCENNEIAHKFYDLMSSYEAQAVKVGSSFEANPSPGNIKDGLITDAMKSAGAAKKGGTAPIVDVLDYTEQVAKSGLNLLCTPGNDVESTTGLAASGANVIVFTTGLGTPTGNPIAPVIKVSTNTILYNKMKDIIDVDAGPIIEGKSTIEEIGEEILEQILNVSDGKMLTKAQKLGQDDFIPWKRDISL